MLRVACNSSELRADPLPADSQPSSEIPSATIDVSIVAGPPYDAGDSLSPAAEERCSFSTLVSLEDTDAAEQDMDNPPEELGVVAGNESGDGSSGAIIDAGLGLRRRDDSTGLGDLRMGDGDCC